MVLPVSPKVGLSNNYAKLNVHNVVPWLRRINRYNQLTCARIFLYQTSKRKQVLLKTYLKMPLNNKQTNAILKFCPIDIPLMQSWWQYGVKFGDPKLDIISRLTCTKERFFVFFTSSFRTFFFCFFWCARRNNSFEPVKSPYFCVGQQKKRTARKEPLFLDM